jgi:DNA-directed RNA polymerase III subunit RPC3
MIERNIPRCHAEYLENPEADDDGEGDATGSGFPADDERNHSVTAFQVAAEWNAEVELHPLEDPKKRHSKSKLEAEASGDSRKDKVMQHSELQTTISQHLYLLANSPLKFLVRASDAAGGNYYCDYQAVSKACIQFEVDNIILARFGALAKRVVRILYDKGKLDEKQIGALGMIKQKDLRAKLTAMQEQGWVDTQEVPRDNSRQPSRTIYLWFYDQDRARKLILTDVYKGMSRLLQRCKVERAKVLGVIEKSERTDVRGQEDKYLTKAEREALRVWREYEEKLLVQLHRQDGIVALMRDFLPVKAV